MRTYALLASIVIACVATTYADEPGWVLRIEPWWLLPPAYTVGSFLPAVASPSPPVWPWSESLDWSAFSSLPSITQTGSVIGLIQATVSPLTLIGTLNSGTIGQLGGNVGSI